MNKFREMNWVKSAYLFGIFFCGGYNGWCGIFEREKQQTYRDVIPSSAWSSLYVNDSSHMSRQWFPIGSLLLILLTLFVLRSQRYRLRWNDPYLCVFERTMFKCVFSRVLVRENISHFRAIWVVSDTMNILILHQWVRRWHSNTTYHTTKHVSPVHDMRPFSIVQAT